METAERLELTARQQAEVLAFINARPSFVIALKNSVHADADYHRWQGHAEARRHLATSLGLTIPHEPGQLAEPAVATATVATDLPAPALCRGRLAGAGSTSDGDRS